MSVDFCFFNCTATTEIYTYGTLFPYTTLVRSPVRRAAGAMAQPPRRLRVPVLQPDADADRAAQRRAAAAADPAVGGAAQAQRRSRKIGRAHAELQSLMRISYAVFCLKKTTDTHVQQRQHTR